MFDYKESLTVTFTLFAVIDIIGSIPVIISMRKKMGHIQSGMATLVAGLLMTLFFLVGEQFLNFFPMSRKNNDNKMETRTKTKIITRRQDKRRR